MLTKGLDLSETSYGNKYRSSTGNWNSVCSACMTASALAVFETNPEKYEAYITKSIQEMMDIINEQQAQINELKEEIAVLKENKK